MKNRFPIFIFFALLIVGGAGLVFSACGKASYQVALPNSNELGSPRGLRMARVITHFHTPYSFDACDNNGLDATGTPNSGCLSDVKTAICQNRVDWIFVSDHPQKMAYNNFSQLLIPQSGDVLQGAPNINSVQCSNGFTASLMTGFEGVLLGLGMDAHTGTVGAALDSVYSAADFSSGGLAATIRAAPANGIVVLPHTESHTLAEAQSLVPDGIEIYNIHANLDPKIRKTYVGAPPFAHVGKLLGYLIDPYATLNPDFIFMEFMEIYPAYFTTWNALVAGSIKVAGLGGSDAHENIFPQKMNDGERLDSYRRLTRFMSNHVQSASLSEADIKAAVKQGRSFLVFEGLGTPVGLDFYVTHSGGTVAGMGDTLSLSGGTATLTVKLPRLHSVSAGASNSASMKIRMELHQISAAGTDTIVAQNSGTGDLVYATSAAGNYRAQIYITPGHLAPFVARAPLSTQEYPWIISNHIYVQ